jgi:hypothetical protein
MNVRQVNCNMGQLLKPLQHKSLFFKISKAFRCD